MIDPDLTDEEFASLAKGTPVRGGWVMAVVALGSGVAVMYYMIAWFLA